MTPYTMTLMLPNIVFKKHFDSHSDTRDNGEILNIDRSEAEEAIKRANCRKPPGVDDSMVEELEAAQGPRHFSDSSERFGNTKRVPPNGQTQL